MSGTVSLTGQKRWREKKKGLAHVRVNAQGPVEWVIIGASPVNLVDVTAIQKVDELRSQLRARGIALGVAREKHRFLRFMEGQWINARRELIKDHRFPTLKAAVRAFERRNEKDAGRTSDQETES